MVTKLRQEVASKLGVELIVANDGQFEDLNGEQVEPKPIPGGHGVFPIWKTDNSPDSLEVRMDYQLAAHEASSLGATAAEVRIVTNPHYFADAVYVLYRT